MKKILLHLLKSYCIFISPLLFSACKFYPTCSIYIKFVFLKYNCIFAIMLSLFRLLRCNNFFVGGYNSIL